MAITTSSSINVKASLVFIMVKRGDSQRRLSASQLWGGRGVDGGELSGNLFVRD